MTSCILIEGSFDGDTFSSKSNTTIMTNIIYYKYIVSVISISISISICNSISIIS